MYIYIFIHCNTYVNTQSNKYIYICINGSYTSSYIYIYIYICVYICVWARYIHIVITLAIAPFLDPCLLIPSEGRSGRLGREAKAKARLPVIYSLLTAPQGEWAGQYNGPIQPYLILFY